MSRLLPFLALCSATLVSLVSAEAAEVPVNIGSRLELLVDDALIDKLDGVAFKLHPPRPAEIALRFNKPWEGSGNHYLTVFRDDDSYHMYYHSVVGRSNSASGKDWVSYTCYAQSRDGVNWIRPNLGLHEFQGSKNNNIVYPGPFGFEDGALLFPYPNQKPDAPPEQRYLAPGARVEKTKDGTIIRLFLFASSDRVRWSQVSDKAIINGLGTAKPSTYYPPTNLLDSDHSLFWDAPSQQYFLYLRDQRVIKTTGERLRAVRLSTSKDLVNWSYPEWTHMHPSPPDQFYTFGARPYFRAPHFYLAFPMRYVRWRNAPLPAKYKKQLGVGVSDTVFVSSRDGLHWDRRFLDAFIRPGLDPLKWTDRSNHTSMGLVPTGPNEMSVYTLEYFRLPEPRVRRYVMRKDGVASINAPYAGGRFTTKPLLFSGNRLLINASTSAVGGVGVEILDADGHGIDRFTGDNVIEFFGDSVEQEARWDQGPDVSSLAGKPIRLRFLMKDADLYSFRFDESETPSSSSKASGTQGSAVQKVDRTAEPRSTSPVQFTENLIWDDFNYNWGVQAVDIDGDGLLDLTVSDALAGQLKAEPFAGEAGKPTAGCLSNLYWFKNDGKGKFKRRYIAKNDAHGRLERHVIADINKDGRPDVVIVDNFHSDLLWKLLVHRQADRRREFVGADLMDQESSVEIIRIDRLQHPCFLGRNGRLNIFTPRDPSHRTLTVR